MASSSGVLLLSLCQFVMSTVDLYDNVWGCTPPSLDRSYMGGPAQQGTQLSLFVNDVTLEEFDGFLLSENEYKLKIKSKHDWNQYVIYVDKGTLQYVEQRTIGCNGKRVSIADLENQVDLVWDLTTLTEEEKNSNEPATITIGYAPHYTLISVQTFSIPRQGNSDGNKQEM